MSLKHLRGGGIATASQRILDWWARIPPGLFHRPIRVHRLMGPFQVNPRGDLTAIGPLASLVTTYVTHVTSII
ncbi:hypothetical protein CITRIK5_10134 [Citricoccus sp. K5]|nr:hypothetical protein CITRIK5_10134 [Citricoccus sp. K5]